MSVDFPEPETPVIRIKVPSGNVTSIFLRLLACAPRIVSAAPFDGAALGGNRNVRAPREILAGERARIRGDFGGRADGDEFAAGFSCAGAEIDDVIGAAHGFFIVLDDEDGVAEIAQRFERGEQAAIVARVQADRRLIENIENAAQSRADLRGQADALGFAAGERGGGAIESEIAEAYIEKKIEALGYFF